MRTSWGVAVGSVLLLILPPSSLLAQAPADTTDFQLTVPGRAPRDTVSSAVPEHPEAWLPAEAAAESVSIYWRELDDGWMGGMPVDLFDIQIEAVNIDSLTTVGDQEVAALISGKHWRLGWNPTGRLWYNRVEGFRLGVTGKIYVLGPARPELEAGLGYGFGSKQWIYDGRLDLPLLRKRRHLEDGTPAGVPWAALDFDISGGRYVRRFGGDDRWVRSFTAFLYGSDPNQYLESEAGRADLNLRPWRWFTFTGGAIYDKQSPLPVTTTWNLFGQRDNVEDNIQAVPLTSEAGFAGLSMKWQKWQVWGEVQWHRVYDSPLLDLYATPDGTPSDLAYRRARVGVDGSLLDKFGNEYLVKVQASVWDRQVPVQWKSFLGDWPTLRGWNARTLAGEEAVWASLDVRFGFDLFRAMRFPVIKKWGLQPLVLFDWGLVNALDGPVEQPWLDGWRANAGFGFGKLLGIPGYKGNVRLYVSHPVLEGHEEGGWRVLLMFQDY